MLLCDLVTLTWWLNRAVCHHGVCVCLCVCVYLTCSQGWRSDLGLMLEINLQWSRLLFSLEAPSVKPCWCLCVSVSVCLLVYSWTLCLLQNKNLSFILLSLSLFEATGIKMLASCPHQRRCAFYLSLWLYIHLNCNPLTIETIFIFLSYCRDKLASITFVYLNVIFCVD